MKKSTISIQLFQLNHQKLKFEKISNIILIKSSIVIKKLKKSTILIELFQFNHQKSLKQKQLIKINNIISIKSSKKLKKSAILIQLFQFNHQKLKLKTISNIILIKSSKIIKNN